MADVKRILSFIDGMADWSEPCAAGVQRPAFTPAYRRGADWAIRAFQEAGLETREDGAGNIFGLLPGSRVHDKWIMAGSHLDSVKCAGKYDGISGVACALEAARMIRESGEPLALDFAVVGMMEEEGTTTGHCCLGSAFMVGKLGEADLDEIREAEGDRTLRQLLSDYGTDGPLHSLADTDVRAFLELHGEQGPVLDREKVGVGVVTAITGQSWYAVTVEGASNHAGTTPMSLRHDAMAAAARIISRMEAFEREKFGDDATFTTGAIQLSPGSPNVIPGKAWFTVDIRSVDEGILRAMNEELQRVLDQERQEGFSITVSVNAEKQPTALDAGLQDLIAASCEKLGQPFKRMPSGAVHDSMNLADSFPTAMIFVPNRDGISHNPAEYIAPEDLRRGADVLYETIRAVDQRESEKI